MTSITINLAAAGLTHAKGKSDRCDGNHDIDMLSVTALDSDELIDSDSMLPVVQALHEQAHPHGTAYWQNCRERGCAEAAGVYDGRELFK